VAKQNEPRLVFRPQFARFEPIPTSIKSQNDKKVEFGLELVETGKQ
jgi:hypothetical protein